MLRTKVEEAPKVAVVPVVPVKKIIPVTPVIGEEVSQGPDLPLSGDCQRHDTPKRKRTQPRVEAGFVSFPPKTFISLLIYR